MKVELLHVVSPAQMRSDVVVGSAVSYCVLMSQSPKLAQALSDVLVGATISYSEKPSHISRAEQILFDESVNATDSNCHWAEHSVICLHSRGFTLL